MIEAGVTGSGSASLRGMGHYLWHEVGDTSGSNPAPCNYTKDYMQQDIRAYSYSHTFVNSRLASSEASRAGKMCQFPGKAVRRNTEIAAGLGCDQAAIGAAI
jgi:hypothetical protein